MNRVVAFAALLVAASVTLVPSASAAPPQCVGVSPLYPNPIQIDPEGCNGLVEYVCEKTIGRLIPYSCDQG